MCSTELMLSRSFVTSSALGLLAALALSVPAPVLAKAHPTPTPVATPAPVPEDPAVTVVARHEFVAWQAGVIDKDHYSAAAQGSLDDEAITHMSTALSSYGALVRTEWVGMFPITDGPAGVKGYTYRMICTNAPVYEQLMIGADGKIDSINFRKDLPK